MIEYQNQKKSVIFALLKQNNNGKDILRNCDFAVLHLFLEL